MPSGSDKPQAVESRIITVRGWTAILDSDLAQLYGIGTKALLQAVRRNRERFPEDFAVWLSSQEVARLKSQGSITEKQGRGGRRYAPVAFTEQGVAMLSSVLRTPAAIAINIEIMRAFVRLRRAAVVSAQVVELVTELSRRVDDHDAALKSIVRTIQGLIEPPARPRRPIGFVPID